MDMISVYGILKGEKGKNNYLRYKEPSKNLEKIMENPVNYIVFDKIIIQCTIKVIFPKVGKNTRKIIILKINFGKSRGHFGKRKRS